MKKDVAIIGKFFGGDQISDGQSVKTKIVTEELEKNYGKPQVVRIETIGWKKAPWRLFFSSIKAVHTCRNVMFMTDENGTKIFPLLLRIANFAGKCKLHYYVIGGWLGRYLDQSAFAVRQLKRLDAIYVELPAMYVELHERGFTNVVLVNKFRRLPRLSPEQLAFSPAEPYRLCFFSRVMQEKGIEEAVKAVISANDKAGYTKYTLDIFGSIHPGYQQTFATLLEGCPESIRYGGVVDFEKSAEVLKDYFALLFPTFYTSEGYPNAVVDAFAAGLPIIATKWNYNADIIRDRDDGILVDIKNIDQLIDAMEYLTANPAAYRKMRLRCLERCAEYRPENAIEKVLAQME